MTALCWREYKVLCCVLFVLKVVCRNLSDMFAIRLKASCDAPTVVFCYDKVVIHSVCPASHVSSHPEMNFRQLLKDRCRCTSDDSLTSILFFFFYCSRERLKKLRLLTQIFDYFNPKFDF
jgi:hypothetical protein